MRSRPRWLLFALLAASCPVFSWACGRADASQVKVYKTAACGCCSKWIEHLRAAGFSVEAEDVSDLQVVKAEHGVPAALGSCHTAIVDGYVVEGHVPAEVIQRLLRERPPVQGIAVPGMPIGSPGMEGPNPEPYSVISFDDDQNTTVYSTHRP